MKIKVLSNWMTAWLPEHVAWQGAEFTRDPACRDYDWLLVYDEMPTAPRASGLPALRSTPSW